MALKLPARPPALPACLPVQEEGMVEVELAHRPEVQEKLRRRIDSCTVKVRHARFDAGPAGGYGQVAACVRGHRR